MFPVSQIAPNFKAVFRNLKSDFSRKHNGKVLLSHYGALTLEMSNSFSEGLENYLQKKKCSITTIKRMFTIVMEGLQNIYLHGEKTIEGELTGHLFVAEEDNHFTVSLGNIVHPETAQKLSQHLEKLNQMSAVQIKKKYLQTLRDNINFQSKNSGLGFMVIALKANSKIDYRFFDYSDELQYFEMCVRFE